MAKLNLVMSIRFALVVTWGVCVTGCGPMTFVVGASAGDRGLRAKVVEPDGRLGSDRVAIIDVSGMIVNASRPRLMGKGENPVSLLYEKLEHARRDPKVKAIILRLNTPGGTVTASDVMYRQVKRFKKLTGKPVVALLMDVAASGGYYLACSADAIMAHPTTVTGSIGVILQTFSVKPALGRIGIQVEAITSGPNKDAGSPFSTLTQEHRQILRSMVETFYNRFVQVVRKARPDIDEPTFRIVTDGRVLSGEDAIKQGLVDRLGDLYDAFDLAKSMAGLQHADLVVYHRPLDYVGSPFAHSPAATPVGSASIQVIIGQLNFPDLAADPSVGFYYLWQPPLP